MEINIGAKVNLCLYITSLSENGYHCLDSVTASVNIADTVSVSKRGDSEITVRTVDERGEAVPIGREVNSAYRAASAMQNAFGLGGMDIEVVKRIPLSAGLGGSSADAAGVIAAVRGLYGLEQGERISDIALGIGCDVPFMLRGGFARVTGAGENVERLDIGGTLHLVIAKGAEGCSTKDSYKKFDELNSTGITHFNVPPITAKRTGGVGGIGEKGGAERKQCKAAGCAGFDGVRARDGAEALIGALKRNDIAGVARNLHNDLQAASVLLCPEIQTTVGLLRETNPLNCIMSGSGSACFGLYESAARAAAAAEGLRGRVAFVKLCQTQSV